jgi:large subunit ribosomal protein L6
MDIPHNVKAKVPNSSKVLLSGPDYQQLTQFAAKIRSNRPPEPYNGKGVFIDNEQIQRKEGKKSK